MAHDWGVAPYPGPMSTWPREDLVMAIAFLQAKAKNDKEAMDEAKEIAAKEAKEKAQRDRDAARPPGTFGGGAQGRTTSAPIITEEIELEE